MPFANCVHDSDLAIYKNPPKPNHKCKCDVPPPPPYWEGYIPPIPPPEYPIPPIPYPYPPCCPPEEPEIKKSSIEGKICKLSKYAATINRMLENLETKKKDVIIKIGDTSFNFGNIDGEFENWEDVSYAATVKKILEHQRGLIQAEIKSLADELDDDDTGNGGTGSAIPGNTGG